MCVRSNFQKIIRVEFKYDSSKSPGILISCKSPAALLQFLPLLLYYNNCFRFPYEIVDCIIYSYINSSLVICTFWLQPPGDPLKPQSKNRTRPSPSAKQAYFNETRVLIPDIESVSIVIRYISAYSSINSSVLVRYRLAYEWNSNVENQFYSAVEELLLSML